MTKTLPKLVLSASRDIPFSQLVLSQKNVRRVKAGLSIEDLAEDIYRRTLLQSINVRPMLDADGTETGMFEVPAGGRRFRALQLLVKTKRMAKDQPVPCVVRDAGIAEEDSLAENVMRVALHPLDQFRAFSALIEAGLSEEDIAARFAYCAALGLEAASVDICTAAWAAERRRFLGQAERDAAVVPPVADNSGDPTLEMAGDR